MTLDLTHAEVVRLHTEIGELPRNRFGPKLLALYQRLNNVLGSAWPDTEKERKR
jgi:hypothetical protein